MTTDSNATGIDVSHYQGDVNWPAVKESGIVFAFAKATDGATDVDPHFAANWQGMLAAGLLRGAYHYYETVDDPAEQAQNFIKTVGSLAAGDMPPVLDLECFTGNYGNATLAANARIWLDTVQQAFGRLPMIYTGSAFWNEYMNDEFGAYPLWIAEYGVAAPKIPNGWSSWTFWQSSQSSTAPGVAGEVDADTFAGTCAQLLSFIQGTACAQSASVVSVSTTATCQYYTVQSGNTLSGIAAQFDVSVSQLASANNIQNPDMIAVGQVLTIP